MLLREVLFCGFFSTFAAMQTQGYEQKLIESIKASDELAFSRVFSEYYPSLCDYASIFVSAQDAEDIVQNLMFWLWVNRSTINIETSLRSYLLTSVRNRCLDLIRTDNTKRKIQQFVYDKLKKDIEQPDGLLLSDMSEQIDKAIASLPENYREVFVMSRFDRLSNKDIADKLGVSVKNVEYYIRQSLKILRTKLQDYLYTMLL